MYEVQSILFSAGFVFLCLRRVRIRGQLCVQQLQVLDRKAPTVVIHLAVSLWPIVTPAIAAIECVQLFDIFLQSFLAPRRPIIRQAKISKHAEPQPIRIGHILIIHAAQPGLHIFLLLVGEWIPEVLVCNGKCVPDWTSFHHPLVLVFHVAPELFTLRICSSNETLHELFCACIRAASSE